MSEENEAGIDDGGDGLPPQETPADVERIARAGGWVPEDEWRGQGDRPQKFLSATEFVDGILDRSRTNRRKAKELSKELEGLRSELGEVRAAAESFKTFSEKALARERQEKENYVQQLETRRAQAISEGDGNTAVAAEKKIAETRAELAAEDAQPARQNPQVQSILNQWAMANPWYQSDPDKQAWADGRALQLRREGVQGVELLDRLSREVVSKFPNGSGNRPGGVEGRGNRSPDGFGKRSFDDLPEEAKKAFDTFRKSVPSLTRKQYLEQYQWDE